MSTEKLHNILTDFTNEREREEQRRKRGRKRARDLRPCHDFNLHGGRNKYQSM